MMTADALRGAGPDAGGRSAVGAPSGIRDYFAGSWSYLRLLHDRRRETNGSILGCCVFAAAGRDLFYHESGAMDFAGVRGTAHRSFRYSFPEASRAEVFFADGRPFHSMDLTAGESCFNHSCPPDVYEGSCRLISPETWQLRWRVTGPKKDLLLETSYQRFADPLGCFQAIPASAY